MYKLSQISLAELARNSVKQSGFEMEIKRQWLGECWYLPGAEGNDISKVRHALFARLWRTDEFQTNVPDSRLTYRHQALVEELQLIGE